jgi:hypothetical protein
LTGPGRAASGSRRGPAVTVQVGLRRDEHELLAAVAVVDRLEVVEVEHEQGEHPAKAPRPLDLLLEAALEVAEVPCPGERVGDRQPLRLGVELDVLDGDRGLHGKGGERLGVGQGERLAVVAVVEAEHAEHAPLGEQRHAHLGAGGRLRGAVGAGVGRAGEHHRAAGGGDRPGDALAERDPFGRVALAQPVDRLADQGGAIVGEQQQAAGLGAAGLDRRLQHDRQELGQVVG